ncbi:PRA1 family protein 3-like [Patiria miniata]|uniref:PRA1 family protein n=1 Tax=Patiria miniata TaxID=46514 RepID=A0A913Z7W2_PATMI|nr:PRA1 family protein 3-like [Patiria miniata]XP_038068826.1 PRA1 family protein 3-like [Patiria miniata]
MDDLEVPSLRSLSDFLLESARFSTPAINDPSRWANRVIDNLLYYQTNYFLTAVLVFLIVGTMNPKAMLMGLLTMVVIFAIFVYTTSNRVEMHRFKRSHPFVCFLLILLCCFLLLKVFGGLLVFMWGIALPLAMIFIHASLRMRNLKNKMGKKLESLGLKRTPMGILLFQLGLEEQARS